MAMSISLINETLGYDKDRCSSIGDPEFRALVNIPTGEIALSDFVGIVIPRRLEPDLADPDATYVTTWVSGVGGNDGRIPVGSTGWGYAEPFGGTSTDNISERFGFGIWGDSKIMLIGCEEERHGPSEDLTKRRTLISASLSDGSLSEPTVREIAIHYYPNVEGMWFPNADFTVFYGIGHGEDLEQIGMWATTDLGLSVHEIFNTLPDGARPCYVVVPTARDNPADRDAIVISTKGNCYYTTDLGDLSIYEYLNIKLWDWEWEFGYPYSVIRQDNMSMFDKNNFAVITGHDSNITESGEVYIIRDGVLTSHSLDKDHTPRKCYWNTHTHEVIVAYTAHNGWAPSGVLSFADDGFNTKTTVWVPPPEFTASSSWFLAAYNQYGAWMESGYSDRQYWPIHRYDANWNLVDIMTEDKGMNSENQGWHGWWGENPNRSFVFSGPNNMESSSTGEYLKYHITRYLPSDPQTKKLKLTIQRTDSYVLLHPHLAKRWEKIKNGQ